MVAGLRLVLVLVVFARWYKNIFVFFLLLKLLVLLSMIINRSVDFSPKKRTYSISRGKISLCSEFFS
jgi:hypothetical protein